MKKNQKKFYIERQKYITGNVTKGHSWKARVSDRYRGSRCPFCYHNRITYEKSFCL